MPNEIKFLTACRALATIPRRSASPVRGLSKLARNCRGGLLLETVLAVTIFTLVGTAVLSGLSTAHFSGGKTESKSIAESLGRSQMERLFAQPYQPPPWPWSFPTISPPPGYSLSAVAKEHEAGNTDVAALVVTVSHEGKEVLVLETLRARE